MLPEKKIWKYSSSKALTDLLSNQDIVFCYGHFNIIHPGHIRYLEHASSLGQKLVVVVQGDHTLTESGISHQFSAKERSIGLAWLQVVDFVLILDVCELADAIELIRPSSLVLGKEYQSERQAEMQKTVYSLKKYGGKVVYHAGEIQYATTELLNDETKEIESDRLEKFSQACLRQKIDFKELQNGFNLFHKSRLLVLGDTILDQYIACDPLGISAEAPVLVVRELVSRYFLGGAAIVAAHVRSLGAQCHFLSVVGQDSNANLVKKQLENFKVEHSLIEDQSRPTTFKIRYLVENQKLFRVSRLQEHSLSKEIEDKVIENLRKLAPRLDGILVCDFVYGIITERILKELKKLASQYNLKLFGDLQCSSQVGNVGKFKYYDLLTPTEREARVALGNRDDGLEWIAQTLMQKTKSSNLIVKLGSEGFIAYSNEDEKINRQHFPALSPNPIDVAGAGDSLLACMAVSLCAGNSLMSSAALGTCMASLAVQTVGNLPISHKALREFIFQKFPVTLNADL